MEFTADTNLEYGSRRSVVLASRAAVASSQPLATEAGIAVLRQGGTAADAAIAVSAALQVTQPCSTGLGGDAFALYFDAAHGRVHAYNGSGRSPRRLTMELALGVAQDGHVPDYHAHTVTVPGAADAWAALQSRFGALPMARVLAPAIALARDGFSPGPMTARWWRAGAERQLAASRYGRELTIDGAAPAVGERFRNPGLAAVLETLATDDPATGRDEFYTGWVARRIVDEVAYSGGVMTLDDLAGHRGEWVTPISVPYGDYRVWECPPNGQGLAALLALSTYQAYRDLASPTDRATLVHAQVESMRAAFCDAAAHIADPDSSPGLLSALIPELLSRDYANRRARLIDGSRRMASPGPGIPTGLVGSDTVYFSVVDASGNACSFINSNFMGFGTGIVPQGCGFSLQNRGRGFVLDADHPNALAPGKRPYHTIIPGMLTRDAGAPGDGGGAGVANRGAPDSARLELAAVFGVMGGMMQPQGHLQVVASLVDDLLDPQSALDRPRWQLADGDPDGTLQVEESMDRDVVSALTDRGHRVEIVRGTMRAGFGLGQVIAAGHDGILWAGSDPRGDGHAAGY